MSGFEIFVSSIKIILSCAVLFLFAEFLIKAILGLSRKLQISTTFLTLTVVAFGTSVPELAACIVSVVQEHPDISVGNVMGSNLFNLLVVAGLSTAISPLKIERHSLERSWCALLLSTALFCLLGLDAEFSILDALSMVVFVVIWIVLINKDKKHDPESLSPDKTVNISDDLEQFVFGNIFSIFGLDDKSKRYLFTLAICGILGVTLGAKFAIDGAVELASAIGISDRVIGLTIISVGTSVPELVVSIVALRHGYNNIALANVVGSNIMNTVGIVGFTALVAAPLKMDGSFLYDLNWVVAITLLATLVTLLSKKKIISRSVGIVSLILYLVYMFTLF